MRIWMHPYLPRRNLRIVIHRWGSLSCAWRPTDSELHRWPVDPTSGNVKLLLPPRQSRGNSHYGLAVLTGALIGVIVVIAIQTCAGCIWLIGFKRIYDPDWQFSVQEWLQISLLRGFRIWYGIRAY